MLPFGMSSTLADLVVAQRWIGDEQAKELAASVRDLFERSGHGPPIVGSDGGGQGRTLLELVGVDLGTSSTTTLRLLLRCTRKHS